MPKEKHRQLTINLLDADRFVKARSLREVSNPVFFERDNIPTNDGLLSNDIFGITKEERANTYAYIDLGDTFIHPLVYKVMCKLDSNIRHCVHGTKTFVLDSKGHLKEDPSGKTGIKFIKSNIKELNFKESTSDKRDRNLQFIEKIRNNPAAFLTKMIVIPAFYRGVNTVNGRPGVGEINELYSSLIIASRSLKEMKDYGFDLSDAARARVQEQLVEIYEWFSNGPDGNGNLSKKTGIIRRAGLSKTTDYGSRLVLSAPMNRVESINDIKVDMNHTAVPLSSVIVNFYPFVLFHVRRFFENELIGRDTYKAIYNGKPIEVELDRPEEAFSDAELKHQMDVFLHSYDNRLTPVKIPNKQGLDLNMTMTSKIKKATANINFLVDNEEISSTTVTRSLTWCDVFFQACVEATKDKMVLITRYPIDSYFNQFATKVIVSSTKETVPLEVYGQFYENYPYITEDLIGTSTGSMFIDSLQMCNAYLKAIGGDYDGDQCSVRGIFTVEANEELEKTMRSKKNYINLGSNNVRVSEKEAIQAIYQFTLVLPETKLAPVQF